MSAIHSITTNSGFKFSVASIKCALPEVLEHFAVYGNENSQSNARVAFEEMCKRNHVHKSGWQYKRSSGGKGRGRSAKNVPFIVPRPEDLAD